VNTNLSCFELIGELESNRPVPFRLTPNIAEFMTPFGVNGPIISGMISLARCLVYPNYKLQALLKAILRDEMISWMKKKQDDREIMLNLRGSPNEPLPNDADGEAVINMVTKSVNNIMKRLQSLSSFDGTESKVNVFKIFTLFSETETDLFCMILLMILGEHTGNQCQ
jgi:transformation/transcription domain-associated protein